MSPAVRCGPPKRSPSWTGCAERGPRRYAGRWPPRPDRYRGRRPREGRTISKYKDIADALKAAIEDGTYPAGAALPAEQTLADEYGVTRPTVRNAVNALKLEGLVTVISGRGAFVAGAPQGEVVAALQELTAAVNRLAAAVEGLDSNSDR